MEEQTIFNVTKSKTVRYATAGTWTLVVAVFAATLYMVFSEPFHILPFIIMLPTTAFVFGILLYYYLISPKSIEITNEAVVLHRVRGRKVFPYADIIEADVWQGKPSELFRFCGSGGFHGFIGRFSGGGIGSHYEYVGRYADAFYVKLSCGKTYLLSCDNAEKAVERVNKKVKK